MGPWDDPKYRIDRLQREIDDFERGAASMERALDKEIEKNYRLMQELQEANLEIARLNSIIDELREQGTASLGFFY